MSRERLSMRKVREVLRLKAQGLSNRSIATSCCIGVGTVHDYLRRAGLAGPAWPLPEQQSDEDLDCRLFPELMLAKADGSHGKRLQTLARFDLLILDDWGLAPLTTEQSRDFLEILDDRYDHRSTMVVAQAPVDLWHSLMADPTIADAALDRLVHNAHQIEFSGESMIRFQRNH